MASISNMKKLMENMEPNSFLDLLGNVVFKDINNLSEFAEHKMFYEGDVALISASITGEDKDKLFVCNRNGTTGPYQQRDWRVFTLVQSDKHSFLESITYTAKVDGEAEVPITKNISLDVHQLTLTHSVRGRLRKGIDWDFKNRDTISLKNFTLYEGERIDIDFYE